ncbi:MAG: hypothetical protein DHS20C16_12310 [Phycisphaerae bacterium]|nr:MAG: hypothetical protein DHS20C16_12310 [Phycisphaerae bacterium]
MNCTNCGAPLPPKSNRCTFCNTLNDVDLRAVSQRDGGDRESGSRECPHCDEPLHIVQLDVADGFGIDRCLKCHGIFFDPGELEAIIEESVTHVYNVDYPRLAALIEEEGVEADRQITYIKCPDCKKMMNRKAYGSRSGVIVDECRNHGVWLDGRELHLLMKWTKAGGKIHEQKRKEREDRKRIVKPSHHVSNSPMSSGNYTTKHDIDFSPVVNTLVFLYKLIK